MALTDVAPELGLNIAQRKAPMIPPNCFHGIRSGSKDWVKGMGCDPILVAGGAATGDFDGDGHLDVVIPRMDASPKLFRNRGDGTFEDYSVEGGLNKVTSATNGAGFFDLDNDGDNDLYLTVVGGHGELGVKGQGRGRGAGRGTRRGAGRGAGTGEGTGRGMGRRRGQGEGRGGGEGERRNQSVHQSLKQTSRQRDPSIAHPSPLSPHTGNLLFLNDGVGHFTEVAAQRGADCYTTHVHAGMSVTAGDIDNDGFLDLFVGEWLPESWRKPLWANGMEKLTNTSSNGAKLLRNRGSDAPTCGADGNSSCAGYFEDITVKSGIFRVSPGVRHFGRGIFDFSGIFVDLDQDGWTDLFIVGDFGSSVVFLNQRDGTFRAAPKLLLNSHRKYAPDAMVSLA